jgi:2-polyprenyl-6-methoxyphenol hydroxylase-like FAD-dependent oxidoreductase
MTQHIAERNHPTALSRFLGRQAIVIGAGIAGLAAAGALADWFERVIVLERDGLFDAVTNRPGTPQAWHSHGLLVGGRLALEELFPDLGEDFVRAGAVSFQINRDMREEPPNSDPMPQRDFGWTGYTMTRPLIEFTLRRRVSRRTNVTFRHNTRAVSIATDPDGRRVTAVRCVNAEDERSETLPADLIVDASGHGHPTTSLLRWIGGPPPDETSIGIDLGYTTAVMAIPGDAHSDWKVVATRPNAPQSSRAAILLPVEGNRWMMTVAGHGDDRPPGEWNALLAYLRQLTTPTIYNAVRHSSPIGKLTRFGFPASVWKHFERLQTFPDGLIPIGDAICRFNPTYGQGMTVAAKEASLLQGLLGERASESDPLTGLGQVFLAEAKSLIETPWTMAALPDFAFPETRGDRPADFEHSLRFTGALTRIAARDEAVQRLMVEVWHLLKPHDVYQDPDLVRRVQEEMACVA